MERRRILVLFAQEWDRLALADPALTARYAFIHRGFDLFAFPENARLMWFDAPRAIDRLARFARARGVAAVISPHEQFGIPVAACLARRLGLPGADPKAVLTAQHKFYAREAIVRAAPEAVPPYGAFRYSLRSPADLPLAFPFFVKPVKATFSVLARRVDDFETLRAHLRFKPFEKHIIERLIRPFNDLLREHPEFRIDAHHLIAEGLVEGLQVNVDGYAERGEIRILGLVDEIMYPGTMAFNRFEYPSSLPAGVQRRIAALARTALAAVGFDHGMFNIELCYDPRSDRLQVIEINPRVASQFIDFYQRVDGIRLYDIMLDLALGQSPRCAPARQAMTHAASFVFRRFDGLPVVAPNAAQLDRVARRHPDAHLMLYPKRGAALAREMKWLGSHRYAVLNLAGRDREHLYERYRDIRDTLGFTAHAGPEPVPAWSDGHLPAPVPKRV